MKAYFAVTNDLTFDQRMNRICDVLSQHEIDVTLVGRELKNSLPLKKKHFRQFRLKCFFFKGKLFYAEYNIRLFFFLLFQKKIDVLVAIDLDTILPILWIAKLKHKICVYDAHEYFTEVPEVVKRPIIKAIWEKIASYAIPSMNYCYTVSDNLAKILSARYKIPFKVIKNVPFSFPNDAFLTKIEQKIILYQGALNEGRGLEQMIQAMQKIDDAVFWIAGEGNLSIELRAMVEKLNLSKKVKFLGYILPDDLRKLTTQCYVGINILENKGLSYYFSLANKCFDYIQAEIPAIHSAFPEYKSINEQFEVSILVESLEIDVIESTIKMLLNDKDLYNRLANNCKSAKKQYNWEIESQKLIDIYQEIKKRVV